MNARKIFPVLFLLALACLSVQASATSVFGLELARPLAIPECPMRHITRTFAQYDPPASGACFERTTAGVPLPTDTVKITWAFGASPVMMGAGVMQPRPLLLGAAYDGGRVQATSENLNQLIRTS
jgi:hypothetical protein